MLRLLGVWTSNPFALIASFFATVCGLCFLLGSHRVLRWPLLLVFGACGIVVGTAMVALHLAMLVWEWGIKQAHPVHRQCSRLDACHSEEAWLRVAATLDDKLPRVSAYGRPFGLPEVGLPPRQGEEHPQYNHEQVRTTMSNLRLEREKLERGGDAAALLRLLGSCVRTNFCGIDNEELYAQTHTGTNPLIQSYVEELVLALAAVGEAAGRSAAEAEAVRTFLRRSARSFGRTGLILSGGGMLCNYHWGVALALLDQGCLPTCLCGTSAGAAASTWWPARTRCASCWWC